MPQFMANSRICRRWLFIGNWTFQYSSGLRFISWGSTHASMYFALSAFE
jgi:hypothetical protein